MSEAPRIYGAICAAMADIGAIGKEKRNQQHGFMYRGIDDVMNALSPVLVKHQLFLCPEVLEHRREERQTQRGANLIYSILTMRYTLYASDGSSISATVIGEGMDSADKSSNKAMSVAMKYAMFQLFCIPTEEMLDPDASSPESSVPAAHRPAASSVRNVPAAVPAVSRAGSVPPVAVSQVESAPPTAQAQPNTRSAMVNEMCQFLGMSMEEFGESLRAMQKRGLVVSKPTRDMNELEFQTMLNEMNAHYGPDAPKMMGGASA